MTHLLHKLNVFLVTGALIALLLPVASVWADVEVTPEILQEKVTQYIQDSTPLDDKDAKLHVEIVRLPFAPISLKGDTVEFFFTDSRTTPLSFRTIVQVTLSTETEKRQIGIPVHLSLEKQVWVAKKMIRAKDAISMQDVTLERKLLDYDAPYSLNSQDPITSYTSRVNLSPGSVLDVRKLKMTPAVYRNDDVHMIMALASGVNITVYGKALEDGAIGKRIQVSQRMGNAKARIFNAEVVSKNTVMVRM